MLAFYNVTYCHSSWEFLRELKLSIFIPVLCSPAIWLASPFTCIAGDRANGESSASQQQFSVLKKRQNQNQTNKTPNQTNPETQKEKDKKDKKVAFCCFIIPATFPSSHHEKAIHHCLTVHVLGQVLQLKQQYPCFFIRNRPVFWVSPRKKPDMFFTPSAWLPSKVYKVLTGRDISSTEGHQKIKR